MMAPWWVPLGPRSCGCRSWTSCGAGGAQRQRPGAGVAVGVAGVGEHVAETDPGCGHRGQHGHQGADRVVQARRHGGAAGELGDGGAVLVGHRDRGGQVVAVEQLVLAAQQVVLAVSPGCLGVGAGAALAGGGREKDSRSVQSTASDALASLNWPGMDASSRASQTRCSGPRAARRVRPRRGRPRPGRRSARSAGRSAGEGRLSSLRSRRAAAGRPGSARSAPGGRGSGARQAVGLGQAHAG